MVRRRPRRAQKAGTAPDQVRVGVGTDSTRTASESSDPSPPGRPTPPTASELFPPLAAFPPTQQPYNLQQPRFARLYTPDPAALRASWSGVAAFRPPAPPFCPRTRPPRWFSASKWPSRAIFRPSAASFGPSGASLAAPAASLGPSGASLAATARAWRAARPAGGLSASRALAPRLRASSPLPLPQSFYVLRKLTRKFLRST